MADVVSIICFCSWFDGCFLFGPSLTPLTRTTGRMCHHGKTLVVRGNAIAERQAKELWHGSAGAVQMYASVSEGFLHRNRVLSVPSEPPLSVVLSKPGSRRWAHLYAGCEISTPDLPVAVCRLHGLNRIHEVLQSWDWLDRAHILGWPSSIEMTSWHEEEWFSLLLWSLLCVDTQRTFYIFGWWLERALPQCVLARCSAP